MSRTRWWLVLLSTSVGVLLLDYLSGPFVQFPILFVIPVCLGAWYLSRDVGMTFAIVLSISRLATMISLESTWLPVWASVLNAVVRMIVLLGLAMLTAHIASQRRELEERVQMLEGILPICAFCKSIRLPDGTWERIESYISKHSAARFSHGFCESCGREHYPEMYQSR